MSEYIIDVNDSSEMYAAEMGRYEELRELIRCKDCKHQGKEYHEDSRRKDGGYYVYWCEKVDGYSPLGFDNQYCSEAERKEE